MNETRINNLSPLPFYQNYGLSPKWDAGKEYTYGNIHPLLATASGPAFFLKRERKSEVFHDIYVYQLCEKGGPSVDPSDFKKIKPEGYETYDWKEFMLLNGLKEEVDYIIFDVAAILGGNPVFPDGYFYIGIATQPGGEPTYISEIFRVADNEYLTEGHVQISWSNTQDVVCGEQVIPYTQGYTENVIDVESIIGRPEYIFEEEGENRMGFFYPTKQVSYKKFRFSFVAPEYLCDCLRLIPLSDHISIEDGYGRVYQPLQFNADFNWLEGGYLADVQCEFITDTVVKKIGSGIIPKGGDFNNQF